jgi:hypothetical protein
MSILYKDRNDLGLHLAYPATPLEHHPIVRLDLLVSFYTLPGTVNLVDTKTKEIQVKSIKTPSAMAFSITLALIPTARPLTHTSS